MAGRWMLERAGITNVYQYGEEVLHFGGGRLLLRGVNGSGKSTAMNMLLPFLLEADTRRIDAAGEQAGVLRSWMLSGRDEQQPQGYLWVEFAHGTEHLTFGCGIRANRSTDRVTTWWFITAKRPDIDFRLVEGRRPLSADALRAVLEPGAVYSHDQRAGYRSEVRSRLFLGADLDQHLRLLHVVRNPRVGDRIDVDLPQYLTDALPQLSEVALDDAAQPLEDLEEHRRNVEDLERTAAALRAIEDVYRNYARAELHRAADHALALVQERARAERTEKQAWTAWQAVVAAFDEAGAEHRAMIAEARRLDDEIRNLEASDAYQAGASLNDLRHHVDTLASEVGRATEDVERSDVRTAAAERAVISAQSDADAEHDHLRSALSDLADDAAASALTARPPAAPALTSHRIRDDSPLVAIGPLEPDPVRVGLAEVRAAAHQRVGDVGAVRAALADVSLAEDELRQSERRRDEAEEAEGAAADAFAEARRALQQAVEQWRRALDQWTTTLAEHRRRHELSPMLLPVVRDGADDSALEPEQARASWLDLVERTIDHHRRDRADLAARRSAHDEVIAELEAELGELISRTLPKPPTAPWQRRTGVPCLAELIDFAPDLPAEQRADLEGAMEAAGLLGAELADHGALVLADGSLAVRAGTTAARAPLAALLVVAIPPGTASTIGYPRVQRVLDAISTDSIDATDGQTVVTTDGHFQIGPLQGRHTKPEAEHIGASARRAALDRQRAQARRELDEAIELRDQIDQATDVVNGRLAEADALRRDLPSTAALAEATTRSDLTEASLETARDLLAGRRDEVVRADQVHGVRVDAATRTAATLGLPTDRGELDRVTATLRGIASGCDRAETFIAAVVKAVAHWIARTTEWEIAVDDETLRTNTLARLRDEHRDRASKLATLEDAVSADYDDIVQTIKTSQADLKNAAARRDQAREAELARSASAGGAEEHHHVSAEARRQADERCAAVLPDLRAAIGVPGLLLTATTAAPAPQTTTPDSTGDEQGRESTPHADTADSPEGEPTPAAGLPHVAETPEGVRELALALRALIPVPATPSTAAEGVRQSLRQRRDSLGAGWDAEDHQPDDRVPLHVEVTGPLGRMPLTDAATRVRSQLHDMTTLLSAKQDQALRNLLQGLVAREVAEKLHAAGELVQGMNHRLATITTSHGIGVSLRWRRRDDLDPSLADTVDLLGKPPDLRTLEEDQQLTAALSRRIAEARQEDPEKPYRELIAEVLDYRAWHRMALVLHRPGRNDEQLKRRTALSEGEKKMVTYLPLFAAVAASCDALAEGAPDAPRFVLLDDAFAKVSEDNHAKLFGLLVELDLDFIATSERLWGTHDTVPELVITEVIRDADLGTIVLEHSRWNGRQRELA